MIIQAIMKGRERHMGFHTLVYKMMLENFIRNDRHTIILNPGD